MNLSLPLLFARKSEKKIEKLLVLIKISLVICLVKFLVLTAFWAKLLKDALRNDISYY